MRKETHIHRSMLYRWGQAARAIRALDAAGAWDVATIQEECNEYVHGVVRRLEHLWARLLDCADCDAHLASPDVRDTIWTSLVQATFEAFVEGIASVEPAWTACFYFNVRLFYYYTESCGSSRRRAPVISLEEKRGPG